MIAPDPRPSWPSSGRNSTYPTVQISRATSEFSRDRIQEGLAESNVSTAGFEAFKKSISRQLAARAARLESSSLGARSGSAESDTIGNRQNNLEKPGFSSPLFILALGFALGVSAGAGAMYYFQSINLRSSPPSPSVLAAPELPSPSATATTPPQTTTATTPLPAVDPMATLQPPSLKEAPSPQPEPVKVDVITSPQPPPRFQTQSGPPQDDGGDGDGGCKVSGQLVVASGDAAPVLEPTEHALYDIAALVDVGVEGMEALAGRVVGDHRLGPALAQELA